MASTRTVRKIFGLPAWVQDGPRINRRKDVSSEHILAWSHQNISLEGWISVANQVIIESIWYISSCANISTQAFKLARALIRNFVW